MLEALWSRLTPNAVQEYLVQIEVQGDWVCFKDAKYPPESVSGRENRFNVHGQACYYAASGIQCARAEVPNWNDRDLYSITPHTINAFDLPRFARDNKCENDFLRSKAEGGYAICQSFAQHLGNTAGVTGILYNSYEMHQQASEGLCLALFPESGQLVGATYFINDESHPDAPT